MIIDFLLDLFEGAFNFIAGLLPDTSASFVEGIANAISHLGDLNYFIPIQELVVAVMGTVIVLPFFLGTTLLLWLVSLIRGGSSRG